MDIIIQTAKPNQLPELKKIWAECFDDGNEYIELFFRHRYPGITALTAICSGKTVGAVYLMPVLAEEYGVIKKGMYIYAAGVLKEYRKNGIFAAMQNKINLHLKQNDEFCILCPANQKLYGYYCNLGYSDYSYLTDIAVSAGDTAAENFKSESISAEEYIRLRNSYFKSDGLIRWNEEAVNYAMVENTFCGGYSFKISDASAAYAILARPFGDTVKIIESTVPQNLMKPITNFICKKYGKKSAIWTRASYDAYGNQAYISALSINLKKAEYPYMNLLLN